jgi:phosphopantetheinyl transferase
LRPLQAEASCCLSALEQGWCAQLSPRLQTRYSASRSWMRRCLAELLNMPPQAVPLHSPPGEAPALLSGGYVSLSHSGEALLIGWSPGPIGVDLEPLRRPLPAAALAARFFPPQEWQRLQHLPEQAQRSAVLESWVRKEAAIKWQRSSLARDLSQWHWDDEADALTHLQQGWSPSSICTSRDGWLCAAAGEGVDQLLWG